MIRGGLGADEGARVAIRTRGSRRLCLSDELDDYGSVLDSDAAEHWKVLTELDRIASVDKPKAKAWDERPREFFACGGKSSDRLKRFGQVISHVL